MHVVIHQAHPCKYVNTQLMDMPMCHSLETTKDVLGNVCASYSIPSSFYSRWANVLGNLAYLLVSRTMPWLVEGRLQPRSFLREVGYLASKHARGCPLPHVGGDPLPPPAGGGSRTRKTGQWRVGAEQMWSEVTHKLLLAHSLK